MEGMMPVSETRNIRNRDYEERKKAVVPVWRAALGLLAVAVAILPPRMSAQIQTTTVQGTVYRADGTPAGGTLLLNWPAFTTPQNQAVAAGTMSAPIGADGYVSVNLTPNAAALPTGTYYTAVYHLNDGTVNQEYWVVPSAGNASIASVRAQLQPSTIAVQPVSKSYLDSAIASLNGSWLPLAGGTLSGALNLSGDPSAANQAATKHYADQLAAAQLPLSGGTVTDLRCPQTFVRHARAVRHRRGRPRVHVPRVEPLIVPTPGRSFVQSIVRRSQNLTGIRVSGALRQRHRDPIIRPRPGLPLIGIEPSLDLLRVQRPSCVFRGMLLPGVWEGQATSRSVHRSR
jgi:hypothetical protein